ncbi:hypothetical protein C9439_04180 [archaeon SCG-AAA382B04]|nr:hypothetical protein C9439_04180 [archaeon SCG-AAA382B04]
MFFAGAVGTCEVSASPLNLFEGTLVYTFGCFIGQPCYALVIAEHQQSKLLVARSHQLGLYISPS